MPVLFTLTGLPPIVIAHRGASGERPEHTLEAYARAIAQGADFIEPDLVVTQDGVLVARHENAIAIIHPETGQIIEATTDVAEHPEFANRLTTKIVDGHPVTGWFTEDFTLTELKSLQARERLPQLRGTAWDHRGLQIPTLVEIIELIKQTEAQTGHRVGIYPETKHPTYFRREGTFLDGSSIHQCLGELLINTLKTSDFTEPERIYLQSFEVGNLQELSQTIMPKAGVALPLIQLIGAGAPYDLMSQNDPRTDQDLITPQGLAQIATYAQGIGVAKRLVLPVSPSNRLLEPTSLIRDAHAAALLVHIYTLRNEAVFLAHNYNGNPEAEVRQFIQLGVDGYFTDFPETGRRVQANEI